ncbi:MAG TPA: DUF5011 domain-containing protein [Clostridiales bacterium]|nr:DUF5011 domain-containing protein [Clostridiales bacterium]
MRTGKGRHRKRRTVKKRFYIFVLVILIAAGIAVFHDKISASISDMAGDNKPQDSEDGLIADTKPTDKNNQRDTEPPVITGEDVKEVFVGDRVSYKNHVTVTDNMDDNVKLEIDSSAVNLKKAGTYTVIYKATDSAGNTATKTVQVIVKEKPVVHAKQEEVDQIADQILESIFEDGMTLRQKARAIYVWVRSNIRYNNEYENNTDWVQAAYDGFTEKKGDCYVFFGVTKELLNRAGIENMDIVKTGGGHYWSMVNLGEGWYHYDTTPRKTGGEFFMMTDAELEAYSNKYGNSHVWDRDKYPATPLE